jgi:hypothetical protein
MAIIESTPRRLVIKAGGASLTLDKDTGKGSAQRTVYFVKLKPVEFALSDIEDVKLESFKDNLSGAMTHTPLIKMRGGIPTQAVPAKEGDAAEMTQRVREFLGLKA